MLLLQWLYSCHETVMIVSMMAAKSARGKASENTHAIFRCIAAVTFQWHSHDYGNASECGRQGHNFKLVSHMADGSNCGQVPFLSSPVNHMFDSRYQTRITLITEPRLLAASIRNTKTLNICIHFMNIFNPLKGIKGRDVNWLHLPIHV